MRHFDTIVAPITGTQPAAVAWIRLSGPDSWLIASKVFKNWPDSPKSHWATFGTYHHGDEGLALPFEAERSYTGEQAVELSLHGSQVSVRHLVEKCVMAGSRMAEPGEFTLRAFLNGRIDLTQAEAVKETVEAQTDAQLHFAKIGRSGTLRREFTDLREKVLSILARVEASVDFSEEIGDLDKPRASAEVEEIVRILDGWIATSNWGEIVRTGYRVAILGRPNAGKSSLMNALLRRNRSIVTEVPGTTRDYLEETIELAGWPVVLIDTAGLRATEDPVESIGVELTRVLALGAHHVLYLFDASTGWTEEDKANTEALDVSLTIVANKVDLAKPEFGTPVSTVTREGIEDLLDQLAAAADFMPIAPLINLRHLPFVEKARASLDQCLTALAEDSPDDLLSVLLAEAAMSLGAITGETATPDMIDRIFHDFCIGK